ncbi:HmuY family protein [Sphingobacterium lactis]|uniref:HmuY family protein n=1 Tax=Sphingobacterium lactis TaxID=797291 RepID=UPI003DA4BD95
MNTLTRITSLGLITLLALSSCETRGDDPIPVVPPSEGSKLTLQGGAGESDAANAVYVDFSADKQTSVDRKSWSLGFYNQDAYRVILNNQAAYAAKATDKTDILAVNSTNTDINVLAYGFGPEKLANYDGTDGDMSKTVIAEISAAGPSNLVYIVNTVHGGKIDKENVYKVRINRGNSNDYILEYAKIDEKHIQKATIKKDAKTTFTFFSFTGGTVQVEPAKDSWDIVWTKSMFHTGALAYAFSDLVFINHLNGVSAAEVIFQDKSGKSTGQPSYEEFDASKLSNIELLKGRNTIGSSWRRTTAMKDDPRVGVMPDRYYVIRDQVGNIYKLRFLAMGVNNDGGKRGYPEIEYKLVKGK